MNESIDTLQQIAEDLETMGYEPKFSAEQNTLFVPIGPQKSFTAVLTITDNELTIQAGITTLEDIGEENFNKFAFAALDTNTRIQPFAFGILTTEDDVENEDTPVVLTNSVPLGDFSTKELEFAMQSLWKAILGTRTALQVATADVENFATV